MFRMNATYVPAVTWWSLESERCCSKDTSTNLFRRLVKESRVFQMFGFKQILADKAQIQTLDR